ncbi:TPM domain-containing protein [Paraburkholderia sp. J69-1]|uniref:TPM domain-containing protein n=2 Tax=unclassified Paraburkholderia TaxID=2615204 RepID=UPI002AB63C99|nr:TPM domain-containing protein [Paraburkholderia sp. J69-1]
MMLACACARADGSEPMPADVASQALAPVVASATDACSHVVNADAASLPQTSVGVPDLAGRVTDTTGIVTAACKAELTRRLASLEDTTGVQLAVLLVETTGQQSIEQYATAVFDKWKLGQQNIDNGVLLVAALKDHRVRIEVGYGLEGTIPDVLAADIIRTRIVPAFRSGHFERGIRDAVNALSQHFEVMTQEILAQQARAAQIKPPAPKPVSPIFWTLLALANVVLGVVAAWRKLSWKIFLPGSYLASSVALVVGLPRGTVDAGSWGWTLVFALLLPVLSGVAPMLLGIGLVRSARVRIWTAAIAAVLGVCIAIGHSMGYSVGQVLGAIGSTIAVVGLIVTRIGEPFGVWGSRSSSKSSSWFGWFSKSGSGSPGRFSGGGGKSGGGGASDSW